MIKTKITKSSIPILFIDTFFFIDFIGNRHNKIKSHYFNQELELVDLIVRLTKEKKLLCPEGDQEEEYQLGIKYEDEIRKEQAQLSLGIRTMYHYGVYKFQLQHAMSAYVKGDQTVEYDYKSIFETDPLKGLERALNQHYIISVNLPWSKSHLRKQRKTKKEIAKDFERLRKENIKLGVKYKDQVKRETLGKLEAIVHTLKSAVPKLAQQQSLTKEEVNGLQIFADYLAYLSHYYGKDITIKEVADFIKSDYYATIPYISIQSKLYASLLTQQNRVKETDNFDFHQTSQILPFSTYFLTDSLLKHRLTTNPLKLDDEYGVKIYSMKEIGNLIAELQKL